MSKRTDQVDCIVVGAGPAGMMLGLLLARAGVRVSVLEKHGDFLRDFRGDTVHGSTLTLLDELGLGERFAELPQRSITRLALVFGDTVSTLGDLGRVSGPHKHIALVPQWDFLDLLADEARTEPTFELRMKTEVTGLVTDGQQVRGVRYRTADGEIGELRADLTVACDGRHSSLRSGPEMRMREYDVPMDYWWFRVPRTDDDAAGGLATFRRRRAVMALDRGDYFQISYMIPKGSDAKLRADGISTFHDSIEELLPWTRGRMDAVRGWDEVKLLDCKLNRLRTWYADGLLCIGDAAHAMSPVGGVGINLAIQDSVAAATILATPLRSGAVSKADLARVQRRRRFPTVMTLGLQRVLHRWVIGPALNGTTDARPPLLMRVLDKIGPLQGIPAQMICVGVRPEHAPAFARRTPAGQRRPRAENAG